MDIKLTSFSHGAGCGCKISPEALDQILKSDPEFSTFTNLLVGNDKRDDAAVYRLSDDMAVISTTDFFMPIVDDPFEFGAIASVNAISDVYAMGGTPLMAISILGWPVDKIPLEAAREVVNGARHMCAKAGIPLAGGHSIDSPEPIFGLAVTGTVPVQHIKSNSSAQPGDELYLTKPLGVGILTTAQKRGTLKEEDYRRVVQSMMTLNDLGIQLGTMKGVHALTDVTGFGLLGHLAEMCEGSGVSADLWFNKVPLIKGIEPYIEQKAFPGGTTRNWNSYGHKVKMDRKDLQFILCDPQTSGGLLVAIDPAERDVFLKMVADRNMILDPIGSLKEKGAFLVDVIS